GRKHDTRAQEGPLGSTEDGAGQAADDDAVPLETPEKHELPRRVRVPHGQAVHHGQACDSVWMERGEGQSWLAAHVVPDDVRARDAPAVEELGEAPGLMHGRRAAAPGIAVAHAWPVEGDDLEAAREERREVLPDLQVVGIA